jgi:hypothetical protein
MSQKVTGLSSVTRITFDGYESAVFRQACCEEEITDNTESS